MDKVFIQIKEAIENKTNFVLQGGAGSGKTETLKQLLEFISKNYADKKVICITHTNNAVDEIKARVGNQYEVSTIHSFLHSFIKNYKNNIKKVIHHLFEIKHLEIEDHKTFKKQYEKYSKQLFTIKRETTSKVIGKKEFDKCATQYISELEEKINILNKEIINLINDKNSYDIFYNESRFNSFLNLSYGHDGLLEITYHLFKNYPLLRKIICDKYDYIFIDEYQDTNKYIIETFIGLTKNSNNLVIGLFGDSMQGIYEQGVGDINDNIINNNLVKIQKEDNFRCSHEVVDFINLLRNDEIKQEVAYKNKIDGEFENIEDRRGKVTIFYKYINKPSVKDNQILKDNYLAELNKAINGKIEKNDKILMLTNKSIAKELHFEYLYKIFSDRFIDLKDEIEIELIRLQLWDLLVLCDSYSKKNYNYVLTELKKIGFPLKTVHFKTKIKEIFDKLLTSDSSALEALDFAFSKKILKKSEKFESYIYTKETFLKELADDKNFKLFENHYLAGHNTFKKLNEIFKDKISEDDYKDFEKKFKKKTYYINLFSKKLKFQELKNYYEYLNEETNYITMHKTKGSGIDNVLVVLDEYFWINNGYNFKCIYDDDEQDLIKRLKNQKLFYVACSRAIRNLKIIRFIENKEEAEKLKKYFRNAIFEVIE